MPGETDSDATGPAKDPSGKPSETDSDATGPAEAPPGKSGADDGEAGTLLNPKGKELGLGQRNNINGLLWESLAAVLVILVLGGVGLFVLKKLMPRLGIATGKRITVVETVCLGSRKTIHLLAVGSRRLLVAGGRDRLALLADVTDALPPDDPPGARKAKFVIPDHEEEAPTYAAEG